jgi:hypothetical protein
MHTPSRYAKHAALWLLPAFTVWWVSLQPVLLPALAVIQDQLLQLTHQRAQASLNSDTLTDWHIATKLLHPEAAPSGNPQTWNVKVGNPTPFTLGLPMVWMLLLASPKHRLRNTLIATLLISPLTIVAVWLQIHYLMLDLLTADTPFKVYVTATIQIAHQPVAAWVTAFFHLLSNIMGYFTVLVVPALLAYWLNRAWWQLQYQLKWLQDEA